MKQVEDIFKPSTKDLLSIFSEHGVVFQIPSYQRNYAWEKSDLERLVRDVEDGYKRYDIKSDYQTLCFLGSIITVNISDKIDTVSSPLNVVDGQQRLTSTLLLIQSLNLHLKEEFNSFSNIPDSIYRWIEDEIKEIEQNTIACLYSRKIRNNKYYEYLPKIVREGADTLSFRENKFKYSSPTSDYLHQFAKYICEDNKNQDNLFSWQQNKDDKSTIGIINALDVFKSAFKRKDFLRHNDHSTEQLISEDNRFYSLKDFDKGEIKSDLLNYNGEYKEKIERVIQLISFSRFIFFNVVVTEVRTYEKYQFDAFESLNTTGVPLTAIDIFRAKALSSYNDAKKESSISRDEIILLDKVDKYIQSIPQKSRSKESREVVSSFLLYISGIKPEEHLSWQRNKLIELYDKAETAGKVPNLVACLDQIVDFRSNFWKEKQLLSQLDLLDNSEEMLVYFDYFRQLNSTLLIPILARIYYLYYNDDSQKFVRMVKALSNFVLLWRLAHPNTSSIDSVFRGLMAGNKDRKPFSVGLEKLNHHLDEDGFISYLSQELEKKKINTYELWSSKFRGNQIYNVSKPTARLALITCYHKSKLDSGFKITKKNTKFSDENDLLNIRTWKGSRYQTLEHIAPQNIKDSKDWDNQIYRDGELLPNCLGNLTLLPEAENSAIGNNTWKLKKLYLGCFSAADVNQVKVQLERLKSEGINVRKNIIEIMTSNFALGLPVTSILAVSSWNKEVILERQNNFSHILWDQACESLKLEPITQG